MRVRILPGASANLDGQRQGVVFWKECLCLIRAKLTKNIFGILDRVLRPRRTRLERGFLLGALKFYEIDFLRRGRNC